MKIDARIPDQQNVIFVFSEKVTFQRFRISKLSVMVFFGIL